MEACSSGWLASALSEIGEHERACEIAAFSIDSGLYKHGGRYTWVFVHVGLADALLAGGQAQGALVKAQEALTIAEDSKEPIQIAQARFARGRILTKLGDNERALEELRAALALAERHGLDPLARECKNLLDTHAPT